MMNDFIAIHGNEEIMSFLDDAKHQEAFIAQMKLIKSEMDVNDGAHRLAELFFAVGYLAAVKDMQDFEDE